MNDIDPAHSALLVMDMQAEVLAMLGDRSPALLERTERVIAAARAAKMPVIYVVVGFRPGYPELDPRGAMYARLAATGRLQTTTPGSDIPESIRPASDELVVLKHRVSAFSGTELEQLLRVKRIDTLILTGIATSGVVLSTVRHAFDADYRIVVVEDCCADADEEVHRVLMQKVIGRQASVIEASELIDHVSRG